MIYKIARDILHYFKENNVKSVILSISGGVDSIFLLNVLLEVKKSYNYNLALYYVNYNMNKNSSKAESLIKILSKKNNLELYLNNVKLSNKNFESNARNFRYKNLSIISKENNFDLILTAHHYNDQIETLIMKEDDGADWVSFLGIRKHFNKIYRPLLSINKQFIIDASNFYNLNWVEDDTNQLLNFRRNKIRNQLNHNCYSDDFIKKIIKKHIKAKHMISLFNELYNSNLVKCIFKEYPDSLYMEISFIEKINSIEEFKLFLTRIINEKFNLHNIKCTKSHWLNIYNILTKSKQGSYVKIYSNIYLVKERNFIILFEENKIDNKYSVRLDNSNIKWYNTSFKILNNPPKVNNLKIIEIPSKYFNEGIYITHWKFGDFITTNENTKKVSDIFVNSKISNYEKRTYPIIRDNNYNIIWVPGLAKAFNQNNFDKVYIEWKN